LKPVCLQALIDVLAFTFNSIGSATSASSGAWLRLAETMALERGMSYFATAKIINMAVIITMAMVRQRAARGGFLVTEGVFPK
jgi:hypothetical protein